MPRIRGAVRVTAAGLVLLAGGVGLVGRGSAAASPSTHDTTISGYRFLPTEKPLFAGDTVTWTNLDAAPHTVTGISGPAKPSSPLLQKGQTWSFTFILPGTYHYYCVVHPYMTATLVVAPTPVPSLSEGGVPGLSTSTTGSRGVSSSVTGSAVGSRSTGAAVAPLPVTMVPATSTTVAGSTSPSGDGAAMAADPPATFVTTSAGRPQINPLLLLAAIAVAAAVFGVLVIGGRPSGGRSGSR